MLNPEITLLAIIIAIEDEDRMTSNTPCSSLESGLQPQSIVMHLHILQTSTTQASDLSTNSFKEFFMPKPSSCVSSISPSLLEPPIDDLDIGDIDTLFTLV